MPVTSPTSSSQLAASPDTARRQQEYPTSVSQMKADLERNHKAQLRQAEGKILESCTKFAIKTNANHQLEIEKLRNDLNLEHKLQLDKKVRNIHANNAGIMAKKETELQNLTSELYDANQQIRMLKKANNRPQQRALDDLKAKLEHHHQTQLQVKTRNIHTNYSGIIAKKDVQYQELAKEFEDAQQASEKLEEAYQAEITLTKQEHESEKVQLRKDCGAEHEVEIESLRGAHEREMMALKSEHAKIVQELKAQYEGGTQSYGASVQAQQDEVTEVPLLKSDHPETELQQVRAMNEDLMAIVAQIEAVCGKVRDLNKDPKTTEV